MNSEVPRVLFVTPLAFNHFTGGGVTFTNLFRGWPKDRLFTAHADALPLSTDTCVNYFALGADELPLAGPLQMLRRLVGRNGTAVAAANPGPVNVAQPKAVAPEVSSFRRFLLRGVKAIFGDSGFPVSAQLSPQLASWIEAAQPELIYTIFGSIEMMELVEKIRDRFKLPVVVHLMDDWRSERERRGLLSPLRRTRLNRVFERGVRTANGRLAICDAMASAYGAEFGVHFDAVQNVIDSDQWLKGARRDIAARRPARVLYAGSIYPNVQLSSLLGVAASVSRLRAKGEPVTFDVMAPDFMVSQFRSRLEAFDGVKVVSQVLRDRYFETICTADVLLLPVNFETGTIRMLRYSMPTKVPEFLVSGVPILLYAPAGIAQVEYAEQAGWGLAVTREEPEVLDAALQRIVVDNGLRQDLVRRAKTTAATRHDPTRVRAAFRETLNQACGQTESSPQCQREVV